MVLVSGFILFIADASHVIINPAFQIKLGLIAAGARLAGLLSIAIWLSVAACGRSIAYF
jgi:hypothetical protein